MSTTVRSFSKINLGLAIGPVRSDGFHELTTLYQTLAAHDLVTVAVKSASAIRIAITSNDARVPRDERNTAHKAIRLALEALGVTAEVAISIEKRLPVQGGMGAGSANAAAALIALEQELRTQGMDPLSSPERLRIAAEVGSDVPLFLIGGAVLGLGRGEEVYPMPDLPATPCVVALPNVGVSTPQAFRDWDTRALTRPDASIRLEKLSRNIAASLCEPYSSGALTKDQGHASGLLAALVRTGIENDFEEVVFPQNPLFGKIKRALAGPTGHNPEQSAIYAALSGSGAALFGLYATEAAAGVAEARLTEMGMRSMRTTTLPRDEYWSGLKANG